MRIPDLQGVITAAHSLRDGFEVDIADYRCDEMPIFYKARRWRCTGATMQALHHAHIYATSDSLH
jgi:hypothetical protein